MVYHVNLYQLNIDIWVSQILDIKILLLFFGKVLACQSYGNLLCWTVKGSVWLRWFQIPISCFFHCSKMTYYGSPLFILNQFTWVFLFFLWENVYSVSIISNDGTLKIPTKSNQTKLFSFWKCCISALYSIMVLFLYWNVRVYFFAAAAAWRVLCGLWFGLLHGRTEWWAHHSSPEGGVGGNDVPLLLIYQQNPLLLFVDWNICCTRWGGGGGRIRSQR